MKTYPTLWQQKIIWSAVTTVAVVGIGAIAVWLISVLSQVLGFLQPILIPFAVAAVLAYLLEPVVSQMVRWKISRTRAVFLLFAILTISLVGLLLWIVPAISHQSGNLARNIPSYTERTRDQVIQFANQVQTKYGLRLLPDFQPEQPPGPDGKAAPAVPLPAPSPLPGPPRGYDPNAPVNDIFYLQHIISGDWVRTTLPGVLQNAWNFIRRSVGGFLGIFGFFLSLVIVPLYLFYFLIESRRISESWANYLPLRASAFKDEVVAALKEINGYLIAFFRGQLLVSMINGTATAIGLMVIGLDFGLLIGLLLCLIGIIPYLGITICWVPAVIIASVQGGSWLLPAQPVWVFPLAVTGIFVIVQQIDGLFVTPKVVGNSVGLHPVTVIMSVFLWSLLMGGLLGAILAVPMTATLKVLLRRYVWERQFRRDNILAADGEEGSLLIRPPS